MAEAKSGTYTISSFAKIIKSVLDFEWLQRQRGRLFSTSEIRALLFLLIPYYQYWLAVVVTIATEPTVNNKRNCPTNKCARE